MSLKVGDTVVIYKSRTLASSPLEPRKVVTIMRLTKTRAIYGEGSMDWMPISSAAPSSPDEIAKAKEQLRDRAAHWKKMKEASDARGADPAYRLASRFASTETEKWKAIGLERLRKIEAILDGVDDAELLQLRKVVFSIGLDDTTRIIWQPKRRLTNYENLHPATSRPPRHGRTRRQSHGSAGLSPPTSCRTIERASV